MECVGQRVMVMDTCVCAGNTCVTVPPHSISRSSLQRCVRSYHFGNGYHGSDDVIVSEKPPLYQNDCDSVYCVLFHFLTVPFYYLWILVTNWFTILA